MEYEVRISCITLYFVFHCAILTLYSVLRLGLRITITSTAVKLNTQCTEIPTRDFHSVTGPSPFLTQKKYET